MTIQYKFFTIPLKATREVETELNHFLRSQRVLTVHREFVTQGENSFWTMAVEYLSDGGDDTRKPPGKNPIFQVEPVPMRQFDRGSRVILYAQISTATATPNKINVTVMRLTL